MDRLTQKSISFNDDFAGFVDTVMSLRDRKGIKNLNFSGNLNKEETGETGKSILRLVVNWTEEESF
jgi:hypothetical protein